MRVYRQEELVHHPGGPMWFPDPDKLDAWITGDWPEPERDLWPFLPLDDDEQGEDE